MRAVPDPPVVRSVRAELARLGPELAGSALAAVALDLAARLDAEPTDRDATALARELRLTLAELHRLAGTDTDEMGAIVARIGNTALGN